MVLINTKIFFQSVTELQVDLISLYCCAENLIYSRSDHIIQIQCYHCGQCEWK